MEFLTNHLVCRQMGNMKSRAVALFLGIAVMSSAALPANAVVIDFNALTIGDVVTNQFTNVGAVFAPSGGNPALVVDIMADATIGGPDLTGLLAGTQGLRIIDSPTFSEFLNITFVDPLDQVSAAFVTSVSFTYISDSAVSGAIRAFDAGGALLDSALSAVGSQPGNQAFETLTVSAGDIRRIEIDGFADVIIDTITFDDPQGVVNVPEPGSLAILGLGLAGLGFARRKKAA
jgi:hypothetical protein